VLPDELTNALAFLAGGCVVLAPLSAIVVFLLWYWLSRRRD
jgi:hypothetical protein